MKYIEFEPIAEFVDCAGEIRPIYGLSLAGREEFFDRIKELKDRLSTYSDELTWQEVYDRDKRVRFLVKRCLQLSGLKLKWVALQQVEELLICRYDPETGMFWPGWLVELNEPETQVSDRELVKDIQSLERQIAAVSLQTATLEEAFDLAATVPANMLVGVINARAEMLAPPEQQQEVKRKRKVAQLKGDKAAQKIRELNQKFPPRTEGE